MESNEHIHDDISSDSTGNVPENIETPAETPYTDAIGAYLDAADWLGPLDAPLKVHARALAASLDRQLAARGEVQSALAGSFDKVMLRLDARRPAAQPPAPSLDDTGPHGEQSIFTHLGE